MGDGLLITVQDARRIQRMLKHYEGGGKPPRFRRNPVFGGGANFILMRIDEFAVLATNRWAYGFTAMQIDANKDVVVNPDGATETAAGNFAINLNEINNTGVGVEGNSVNVDGADYPAGFELQPIGGRLSFDSASPDYGTIGNNVVVQMWTTADTDGNTVYFFDIPNADDGTCGAPA